MLSAQPFNKPMFHPLMLRKLAIFLLPGVFDESMNFFFLCLDLKEVKLIFSQILLVNIFVCETFAKLVIYHFL